MSTGVIWKQVLLFFIPLTIGSFFQHFYTLVDAMVVGKGLGTLEFAAVGGSASKLIVLITNFFIGVSVGITSYSARSFGEKNYHKLKGILANGLIFFVIFGALVAAVSILFAPQYLQAMGTPEDTVDLAHAYLTTYLYGIVFCVIYNTLAGVLRAIGDAKTPLYALMFCSILNVVLDVVLALVLRWGVFGVAIATVISQGISAVILGYCLVKKFKILHSEKAYTFAFDPTIVKEICAIGIPSGLQSIMFNLSNMAVQSAVNSFSTLTVAGWSAYLKIDGIVDIFLSSLSGTVVPFVGQNFGAKNKARIKESVFTIIGLSYLIVGALVGIFVLLRYPLLSLFSDDPQVVEIGAQITCVVITMYLLDIPNRICSNSLRGIGISFQPMMLTLVGVVGVRFAWVYLVLPINPSILLLGACYPVSSLIMSVIFSLYFRYEYKKMEFIP